MTSSARTRVTCAWRPRRRRRRRSTSWPSSRARDGGVLVRTGQTEGAVDLARLAGLKPAGVICEILKDDGTMARRDDLVEIARVHGLKIVTVADIIEYRLRNETMVQKIAEAKLPTAFGEFTAIVFRTLVDYTEHLVL